MNNIYYCITVLIQTIYDNVVVKSFQIKLLRYLCEREKERGREREGERKACL